MILLRLSLLLNPTRSIVRQSSSLAGKETSRPLPSRAQVVVCGGGVVGSSVAYHLPKCGFKDVLHLEQGSLGCGTTWHSAGLLGAVRGSRAHTKLTKYSNELYSMLEEETGVGTGFKQTGTLSLASTAGRMAVLRRQQAVGRSLGVETEIISPEECSKLCPFLRTDDLHGALYNANDVCAGDPSDICRSMAQGAQLQGVQLYEGVSVEGVLVKDGKVAGVSTNRGDVECEIFVNCAGQWARDLGYLSTPTVNIPLHSTQHFYVITKPFEGIDRTMPSIRDHDSHIYIRHWSGGILAGCFEVDGKACFEEGIPKSFEFQLFAEDWDHCQPLIDGILHRVPAVANAEIRQMCNGPESFTPDLHAIMGEAPEIRNYFVGAAMNSTGIATAGGFGKALAEWIQRGESPFDLWEFDIARFSRHYSNRSYLKERAVETLGRHYKLPWPNFEMESGRRVKMTPFHTRLDDAGASWGCVNGWERPNWFCLSKDGTRKNSHTFHKMNYFDAHQNEHLACRHNLALFDLTAFSKLEVKGEDVLGALQYICTNNVDVPVGHVIYTGILNHHGGFLTDCTVTRLDKDRYLIVSPSVRGTQVEWWIKRHVSSSVAVEDKTSSYCVLALMGPKSRELLQSVTRTSLSNESFPYSTGQIIEVGYAVDIIALRMSYVGELGWELYVPMEYALHVFDLLTQAGRAYDLKLAGAYAMDSLRMEKGFRHAGHELDSETSPMEARLMHSVDLNKGDFIGQSALIKQKQEGVQQLFAMFTVDIPLTEEFPWGKELLYRNGKYCGYVTSANYGFTVGKHICMGYVCDEGKVVSLQHLKKGTYEVEVGGKRYPAHLTTTAVYDPHSTIPKSS